MDAGFGAEYGLDIPATQVQIQQMAGEVGALLGDGTSFYCQFPALPQRPFGFTFQGRSYAPTTIVTGQRQCVALAQMVLQALCTVTSRRHADVLYLPYVDNVRMMGAQVQCEDAWRAFIARAESCNMTFELQTPWATSYTFLGVRYDHKQQTVAVGEKAKAKLQEWHTRLHETESYTMAEMVSLFGVLVCGLTSFLFVSFLTEVFSLFIDRKVKTQIFFTLCHLRTVSAN